MTVKSFATNRIAKLIAIALGAAVAAATAPASAADNAIAYNWSGFYAGANAGWGSIEDKGSDFCTTPGGVVNGTGCWIPNGAQTSGNGFIGGGQIGYNWQTGNFVYGLETDFQGTSIKGSVNKPDECCLPAVSGVGTYSANEELSWLGTARGRVGIAWDRALLYATGGFAYGGVSANSNLVFPVVQYPSSVSTTKTGWTAGGGLEWAFAGNWSGKIEGLYYDLGSISTTGTAVGVPTGFTLTKDFDVQGAIIRAGLNYKFGP